MKPKAKGAIVSNGEECAKIGADILKLGGNVVDAGISTLICDGVTNPQSGGLGGGMLATLYLKNKKLITSLDAREVAPKSASENMYNEDYTKSLKGGLAVAVPGELLGMNEMHKKYGNLEWEKLFKPVIELCQKGHTMTENLHLMLTLNIDMITRNPSFNGIFINQKTGKLYEVGEKIIRKDLAKTLKIIAAEKSQAMYGENGSIMRELVKEINQHGGNITEEDFKNYKVKWRKPLQTSLKSGETIYTAPLPGSGQTLIYILNLLKKFSIKEDTLSKHIIIETYKNAFSRRSLLGDQEFYMPAGNTQNYMISEEYAEVMRRHIDEKTTHSINYYGYKISNVKSKGTMHVSILSEDGDAISITSSINDLFGAKILSNTGIVLNSQMNDFSIPGTANMYGLPPSIANIIKPGKRPLSSMSPTIILKKNKEVSMVIGAAGGSKIPTVVAKIILDMYLNENKDSLENVIKKKRFHHQLVPNKIYFENGFDKQIIKELNNTFNHEYEIIQEKFRFGGVCSIFVDEDNNIEASYDPRRGGSRQYL
ncbi:hypothetical protein PVAND_009590 [Polypedilum vanderplanki]|uniref:Gamma-glutamyltranspeptidase n=1 Tax=Polypedilum vanderplanki TaxID=319348 RepID=A0A9J6CD81_POLVA|nr:hypothetical protein PVAND_009590 [Polypedilum vanderplanki]